MAEVTQTRVLDHDIEAVWPVLADFGGIYKFHPRVARSPLTGAQTTGLGATRRCEFVDGNHIDEQIVDWTEGRSMTVDIVRGSMPLKRAQARIEVEPLRPGRTRVSFHMEYVPKFGPLGWVMNVMMMRSQFEKIVGEILGRSRHALEDRRRHR